MRRRISRAQEKSLGSSGERRAGGQEGDLERSQLGERCGDSVEFYDAAQGYDFVLICRYDCHSK